uniref:MIF4G domain-containing protein n=1 Tax=Meloidogyne incognita TaxID=6306 RepID=A0A914N985_MELIC
MFGNQNVKNMDVPVIDEEVARYEKIKKEMCCLFNEITPSYKELSDQFFAFNFIEDYKLLAEIVDLIFEKVIEEPHLSDLFSDLCKKKVDVERQMQLERDKLDKHLDNQTKKSEGIKTFRSEVITKAQQHWNIFDDYNNKIKQLEEELKNADDKSRLVIEKEIETRRSEEKRRFFGIIKFTGQLYRNSLINEDIIDWCSLELVRQFETTEDEVYLEYAVEFIKAVGKIYDGFHLDIVMDYLSRLKPRVSNRVHSLITDLEDLKKNCWTPRIFTTL